MEWKPLCAVCDCENEVGKGGILCEYHHAYYDRDSWKDPVIIGEKPKRIHRGKGNYEKNKPIYDDEGNIYLSQKELTRKIHCEQSTLRKKIDSGEWYKGHKYYLLEGYDEAKNRVWVKTADGTLYKDARVLAKKLNIHPVSLLKEIREHGWVGDTFYWVLTEQEKKEVIKREQGI